MLDDQTTDLEVGQHLQDLTLRSVAPRAEAMSERI